MRICRFSGEAQRSLADCAIPGARCSDVTRGQVSLKREPQVQVKGTNLVRSYCTERHVDSGGQMSVPACPGSSRFQNRCKAQRLRTHGTVDLHSFDKLLSIRQIDLVSLAMHTPCDRPRAIPSTSARCVRSVSTQQTRPNLASIELTIALYRTRAVSWLLLTQAGALKHLLHQPHGF